MADAMETLKGILGDDAEDKIKNVMGSISNGSTAPSVDDSIQYLMQMRDIMSKLTNNRNDPRANLLMSLKPYMRTGRQQSLDNAVKLLNLSKLPAILRNGI